MGIKFASGWYNVTHVGGEKARIYLTSVQARALFAITYQSDPARGRWRGDSLSDRLGISYWCLERSI